jgi:hypothetical protein
MVPLLGPAVISAQPAEELAIAVSAHMTRSNGGEDPPGMFLSTGPLNRTTAGAGRFSVGRCGAMTLAGRAEGPFEEGATAGWRVEIIPVRVSDGSATFRLKWIRALDTGKDMHPHSEDVELTMRRGDSRLMDSVAIPPDRETGSRCTVWDNRGKPVEYSAVALRVSVEHRNWDVQERRLVNADLWLIERLAGGDERAQALTVRGLPHREIPFYFTPIREQALSLEILGSVIARPESDAMSVELETMSRWGAATFDWREHQNVQIRQSDSRVRVKPGETVEVALGRLDGAGPFMARQYAIRIRAQQMQ